jgi:CHAD domain-containing protein
MLAHELVAAPLIALVRASLAFRARCAEENHDGEGADVELVHDLRVSMRRLRSVLRPVRELYGGRVCDDAEETLRAWLLLTSDLRDEEVLRDTLSRLKLGPAATTGLAAWKIGRARRERGARTRALAAIAQGDARPLEALERRLVGGARRSIDAGTFSSTMTDRALVKLEERAAIADPADGDAMHRVRIAAKKLRYAAALLGGKIDGDVEGKGKGEPLEPRVGALAAIERGAARIQKRLGDLHDLDEAVLRTRRAWGLDAHVREEITQVLHKKRADVGVRAARELHPDIQSLRALYAAVTDWMPAPKPIESPVPDPTPIPPFEPPQDQDASP